MTLTAYAKRRGVSTRAVSKAVSVGRLLKSVVRVGGAPKIANPDLADREWLANSRERRDRWRGDDGLAAGTAARSSADLRAVTEYHRERRDRAEIELLEADLEERRSELASVEEVREVISQKFGYVRSRLLGATAELARRCPGLDGPALALVDSLLREATEELSESAGWPRGDS